MKEFRKLSLEESKNNLYTSGRYHIMAGSSADAA